MMPCEFSLKAMAEQNVSHFEYCFFLMIFIFTHLPSLHAGYSAHLMCTVELPLLALSASVHSAHTLYSVMTSQALKSLFLFIESFINKKPLWIKHEYI